MINLRIPSLYLAVLVAGTVLSANGALAQDNVGPPTGAILDLGGAETGMPAQAITGGLETVSFQASFANTAITFAFREDPSFISFTNVSVTDTTNPGTNLISNGTFASGAGNAATDWTYANVYGATFGGNVSTACNGGFSTCWYDGAVQAYDAIEQVIPTVIGDTYLLSFDYADGSGLPFFSDLSTNGGPGTTGNGVDILAYAQGGLPPAAGTSNTPEPSAIILTATGLLSALGARRRFGKN